MTSSASVPGSIRSMTVVTPRRAMPAASRAPLLGAREALVDLLLRRRVVGRARRDGGRVRGLVLGRLGGLLGSLDEAHVGHPSPRSTPLAEHSEAGSGATTSDAWRSCRHAHRLPERRPLSPGSACPSTPRPEAIEVAWRGLLRIHHPDVAGPEALETAKRINVAHDWLSDPATAGPVRRGTRRSGSRRGRHAAAATAVGGASAARAPGARSRGRPTTAERVAAVIERVAHLTTDELDRLALAEPSPIAFLATLRRFALPDAQDLLDDAEQHGPVRPCPAGRGADRPSVTRSSAGWPRSSWATRSTSCSASPAAIAPASG